MAKKKSKVDPNVRVLWVVKSNRGMMRKSPMHPSWTDNLNYAKTYAKHGSAKAQITKYRKNWMGIEWADVAEVKMIYIGTLDEVAERELLGELPNKRDD
jgi:hypothetical protein